MMNLLDRKGLNQAQRYQYASVLALIASIGLGILTGYLRTFFETFLWIILIGVAIAFVVRRYGRGVQTRFSIMAVIYTLIAILISDVVFAFGLSGLLSFESYRLVLTFGFFADISQVTWIVSRLVTVFIAYSYSRVV